jgi:hypothetical protein
MRIGKSQILLFLLFLDDFSEELEVLNSGSELRKLLFFNLRVKMLGGKLSQSLTDIFSLFCHGCLICFIALEIGFGIKVRSKISFCTVLCTRINF